MQDPHGRKGPSYRKRSTITNDDNTRAHTKKKQRLRERKNLYYIQTKNIWVWVCRNETQQTSIWTLRMTIEEMMSAQKVRGEDTHTHTPVRRRQWVRWRVPAGQTVSLEREWRSWVWSPVLEKLQTRQHNYTTWHHHKTRVIRLIRETHSRPDRGEKPPSSDQPEDTDRKNINMEAKRFTISADILHQLCIFSVVKK